jgi:chemotaxis protein CheX
MNEQELKIFMDGTMGFFTNFSPESPEIGIPYPLKKDESVVLEYTGAIGISGARKGCIYVTANRALLEELSKVIPGMESQDEPFILDMIGELANTISGNAQKAFGENFVISVPMVITGKDTNIRLPLEVPAFVLPFSWHNQKGIVVVGLK